MVTAAVSESRNSTSGRAATLHPAGVGVEPSAASERTIALECQGLSKRFQETQAVQEFSITVPRGHVVALLGPSGCGKTTALRLIAGFENPDAGSVTIGGRCVFQSGRNLPPEKRRTGMVFQEGALFPHLTVAQNVAYGLPRRDGRKERVQQVLAMVGLEHLAHRMPHELSGGQQQRVALARALAPQPEVLLLDEPFSNLDPGLREQVRRDVLEILKANSVTAIFVTHDQEEALFVGDVIAVMRDGRIEQMDSPEEIFHHPATRFVAEFIGTVDFLPGWRSEDRLMTEVGSVEWPKDCPAEAELEVMVRPDCLECSPSEEGQGVIASREFRGAFYLYRVSLPSGTSVRCLLPHTQEYAVGDRVTVGLRCGHSLLPFIQGQAAHN